MIETETYRSRIGSALSNRDYADVEAAWREYATSHPGDYAYLLNIASQLQRHDKGALAGELCLALSEALLEKGEVEAAFEVARASLRASQRTAGLREMLLRVFRARHASNPNLESFIARAGLDAEGGSMRAQVDLLDKLLTFEEGAYVYHRGGWGYGEVVEFDSDDGQMVIDFENRKGHRISIPSATKILERLPNDHIGVFKHYRRAELDRLIAEDPAEVFHIFLKCAGGRATLKQVREEFVPDVLDKSAWSRWWGKSKKALLKDPLIKIGKGSSPELILRAEAKTIEVEVAEKMAAAQTGAAKAMIAREYLRTLDLTPELSRAIRAQVDESLADPNRKPSSKLSLLYLRADLGGDDAPEALEQAQHMLAESSEVVELLSPMEPADRKRAVQQLASREAPDWAEKILAVLNSGDAEIADVAMDALHQRRPDILVGFFADLTAHPRRNPSMYLWFVRGLVTGSIGPELAPGEKPATAMERLLTLANQVGLEQGRSGDPELKEFLRLVRNFLTGRRLKIFRDFLEGATVDYARFLYSKVLRNRGFTDQTRQALMDAIESDFVDLHKVAEESGEAAVVPSSDSIWTTLSGYHRQETELRQIIEHEMPDIAGELGRAASFGDISENAEYSAALEKQERLMRRLGELRDQLDRARILDPGQVRTDRVMIGTQVHVANAADGKEERYSLLGPWDVNLERGIISYMSPVGRGLLGRNVGDESTIELPDAGSVTFKVLGIEAAPALLAEAREEAERLAAAEAAEKEEAAAAEES